MTTFRATDRKAASSRSMSRYKCDDAVAGYTNWNKNRRAEYRCAVRHTRRTAKLALAAELRKDGAA